MIVSVQSCSVIQLLEINMDAALALMMLAMTLTPSSVSLQPDRFSFDTVWLARRPSSKPCRQTVAANRCWCCTEYSSCSGMKWI